MPDPILCKMFFVFYKIFLAFHRSFEPQFSLSEGGFLTAPNYSVFFFFYLLSHILIVIPLCIRWGVCVSEQACAHTCMCACVHVWAIWFLSLCACEADVKACAFSLPSLPCAAPARSEQGENKRGRRGGESAPTVDLAIVGGGTLFPLRLWTHG